MAVEHYRRLVDDICTLTSITASAELYEATNFKVRDIDFSLFHRPGRGPDEPDHVVVHCEFGPLPGTAAQGAQRAAVLTRLLEINFFLFDDPSNPRFSVNQETQAVLLSSATLLERTGAQELLDQLGAYADFAHIWRQTGFLGEPDAPPVANKLAASRLSAKGFVPESLR